MQLCTCTIKQKSGVYILCLEEYESLYTLLQWHSYSRAKQFGGRKESARMFKTKYFQMYSVFSKNKKGKTIFLFLMRKKGESSPKIPPFFS